MQTVEESYWRRRMKQETKAALEANDVKATAIHVALAQQCASRLVCSPEQSKS